MSITARVVSALALLAGALATASPTHAQAPRLAASDDLRTIRFGVAGGVVIPHTGASVRSLENGLHGQAFALVRLPGLPALRLNVDYDHMKFGQPTTGTGVAAIDADRTVLDGVAGMRVDVLHGAVRPYLLAGVGAFNVRDALRNAATSAATGSTGGQAALADAMTSTNLGVDGGAGVSFRFGRLDGFVETRLQNVYTRQRGLIDTKSIQSFPIAFGLTF